MNNESFISITLDKRRKKADGKYPVKLRIFIPVPREQKLYPTNYDFTEKEFKSIWETQKPRKEHEDTRDDLAALLKQARGIAKEMGAFNTKDFELLMYGKTEMKRNVNYYFAKAIERHTKAKSISTAASYKNALDCIMRFGNYDPSKPKAKKEKGRKANEQPEINFDFKQITPGFLNKFENYCLETESLSLATIGIYLRNLRAVFNDAISDKAAPKDIYPFGKDKKKYQIKAPGKVKKALTSEQMKLLFDGKPKTPEQQKAKAFFFFSYLSNGMNFKDILNLKCKNIDGEQVTFVRAKTARSTAAPKPIIVYLNEFSKQVIEQYGNLNQTANGFVFPVLNHEQTAVEQHKRKTSFTRFVNQHFLKYAKSLGLNLAISTYWARHSFSNIAITKGASIEFVGEALGHTDIKTTMNYFAGFGNKEKQDISKRLLEF